MRTNRKTWLLLLLLVPSIVWAAKMQPILKVRAGIPPFAVLETAVRHNDRVLAAAAGETKRPTTPYLTWLADCDQRIQTSLFFPDAVDRIYPVRSFGVQLLSSAGAVDYGVNVLLTPVLLITGNTDSASLHLLGKGGIPLSPELGRDLDHLQEAVALRQKEGEGAGEQTELDLVERNVDFQVKAALARYKERVASGRVVVVGGVFDLANRYGLGANRLILINLNGETDPVRMRAASHLIRLDQRLLSMVGRRR